MTSPHNPADPNTTWTTIIGFVGAVLVFVVIVAFQSLYYKVEQSFVADRIVNAVPGALQALKNEQLENLNSGPVYVSEAQQLVRVPIDEAIAAVLKDPSLLKAPTPATPQVLDVTP